MPSFSLEGKRVVTDGRIPKFPKRTLARDLAALGATLCDDIDESVDAALIGTVYKNNSAVRNKARGWHIPTFEDEQLKMLLRDGEISWPDPPAPSRGFDALSGELRSLLNPPLTHETWAKVQELLDDCLEQDMLKVTTYVSDHLDRMDTELVNELCVPSSKWIRALSEGDQSPKYKLVRHWSLTRLDGTLLPKYMNIILDGAQLTGLRRISFCHADANTEEVLSKPHVQNMLSSVTHVYLRDTTPLALIDATPHVVSVDIQSIGSAPHVFARAMELWATQLTTLHITSTNSNHLEAVLEAFEPYASELTSLDTITMTHIDRIGSESFGTTSLFTRPHTLKITPGPYTSSPEALATLLEHTTPKGRMRRVDLGSLKRFQSQNAFTSQEVLDMCFVETGLGDRLEEIVLGEVFELGACERLRGQVSAAVSALHEPQMTRAAAIPAIALPGREDELRTSASFDVQDALNALSAVNTFGFRAFFPIVDVLHDHLTEEAWIEALDQIKAHPIARHGTYLPEHWEPLLFDEERDGRLDLVNNWSFDTSKFYLKEGASADLKRAAEWVEYMATAPWVSALTIIHLSMFYFTGQKGLIKALIELLRAASPDVVTTRIKQDKKQELLRSALEDAQVLPLEWNPSHKALQASHTFEEDEATRAQHHLSWELKTDSCLQSFFDYGDTSQAYSLKIAYTKGDEPGHVAPPGFEHLRVLEVRSTRGVCLEDRIAAKIAQWLSRARPVVIDVNEMSLLRELAKQGVYSRAYGSSLELHAYITSEQLEELLGRSDVKAQHVGLSRGMSMDLREDPPLRLPSAVPGYETPPEADIPLKKAASLMHPEFKQHLRSLAWTLTLDDLPHLDEIFASMPQLTRLELSIVNWPADAATYLEAFARTSAMRRIHWCQVFDHWSMRGQPTEVKQLNAKQKKLLHSGEGLRPQTLLISN